MKNLMLIIEFGSFDQDNRADHRSTLSRVSLYRVAG